MKRLFLVLPLALAASAIGAKPKAPPQSKPAGPATAKAYNYATEPFDINADTVPPAYRGHDCRTIAKALVDLHTEKDEFETWDAHAERIRQMHLPPLTGTTQLTDYFAFVDAASSVNASYDAEAGILQIIGSSASRTDPLSYQPAAVVRISAEEKSRSQYRAANAHGREVTVTKLTFAECAVKILLRMDSRGLKNYIARLPMSPEEALRVKNASLKGEIKVLYVGKLRAPFRRASHEEMSPTIANPIEARYAGDTLLLDEGAQGWLFNRTTGQVYQKFAF